MSDTPNESMTVRIDYGDGSEPEEHVVTPGFFHFHPAVDDEKHEVTITVIEGDTEDVVVISGDDVDDDTTVVEEDDDLDEDDGEVEDEFYDPGEHSVDEVKAYVTDHPDEALDVLDAEQDGKNRVTLVTWLENFTPGG